MLLGLKHKFHFTPYTATVFFMGEFINNPFTRMMPEFANSRDTVFMLRDMTQKNLNYDEFLSPNEFKNLTAAEKEMYQQITTLQLFVYRSWNIFKKLGFSNLNRVLAASEVKIR